MYIIHFKNYNLSYKKKKFNLNEILKILNYKPINETVYVETPKLIEALDIHRKEDKELIIFLKNFNDIKLNFYEFIRNRKLNFYKEEFFNDLYYYIKYKHDVIINEKLIKFIYNLNDVNYLTPIILNRKKIEFLQFLKKHKIDFETTNYKSKKIYKYDYVICEIKNINFDQFKKRKYFFITLKNFRKAILLKCNLASEYYLNLEKNIELYNIYLNEFNNKLKHIKEKKYNFIRNKQDKKNFWVYISSTDYYLKKNIFKIDFIEKIYNKNFNEKNEFDDKFYFIKVFKCLNPKTLNFLINFFFKDYFYKNKINLFNGLHLIDIVEILTFLIENFDNPMKYYNNFFKNNQLD